MAAHRDRPAPLPVMGPERRVPPADDRVVADADAGAEVEPVARRDRRPRARSRTGSTGSTKSRLMIELKTFCLRMLA